MEPTANSRVYFLSPVLRLHARSSSQSEVSIKQIGKQRWWQFNTSILQFQGIRTFINYSYSEAPIYSIVLQDCLSVSVGHKMLSQYRIYTWSLYLWFFSRLIEYKTFFSSSWSMWLLGMKNHLMAHNQSKRVQWGKEGTAQFTIFSFCVIPSLNRWILQCWPMLKQRCLVSKTMINEKRCSISIWPVCWF